MKDIVDLEKNKQKQKKYLIAKRLLDIVGGAIGLILFCLVYVVLFFPYKVGSNRGPMIFKQARIGEFGEIFNIYKFRSMRVNADNILRKDKELYQKYINNPE